MRQTLECKCEVDTEDRNGTHGGKPHLHVSPDCTAGHALRPLEVEAVAAAIDRSRLALDVVHGEAVYEVDAEPIAQAIVARFGAPATAT